MGVQIVVREVYPPVFGRLSGLAVVVVALPCRHG